MVIGSGPSLTTVTSIWFGAGRVTRWIARVSIGGALRSPRPASVATIRPITPASSSSGTIARTGVGIVGRPKRPAALDPTVGLAVVSIIRKTSAKSGRPLELRPLANVEGGHPAQL